VPVFTRSDDVVLWLRQQKRDVAVLVAVRAALRVIPLIAYSRRLGGKDESKSRLQATLRAFRSVQAAWAVVAYPGEAARLRPAARAAGLSFDRAGVYDTNDAHKVESAADWASAAAGADDDSRRFTPNASRYAVDATLDAGLEAGDKLLKSIAADADLLEQGFSPVSLALSSTLWHSAAPDWAFNAWARLERSLLDANEAWEVWTDWYEARLKAGPTDQAIEVARATIPGRTWEEGPKVVNAQIRRLLEERGIWRYATAGLGEPSTETSDRGAVERRLAVLSIQEVAAIGVRAALRALPLMSFGSVGEPTVAAAFLKMLRITSLTWAAAAYPRRTPNLVPLNAARIDAINSRVGLVRAAAAAAAAYSTNRSD